MICRECAEEITLPDEVKIGMCRACAWMLYQEQKANEREAEEEYREKERSLHADYVDEHWDSSENR